MRCDVRWHSSWHSNATRGAWSLRACGWEGGTQPTLLYFYRIGNETIMKGEMRARVWRTRRSIRIRICIIDVRKQNNTVSYHRHHVRINNNTHWIFGTEIKLWLYLRHTGTDMFSQHDHTIKTPNHREKQNRIFRRVFLRKDFNCLTEFLSFTLPCFAWSSIL